MNNDRVDILLSYLVIAAALIAPAFVYPILAAQLAFMALFACSLNLIFGYAGLLSFGHAAFFGLAAYGTGYMLKEMSFTPELALLISFAGTLLIAFIFGMLAIRRQGIYFAMITMALSQLVYFFIVTAPFANNEDGYQGIPRGKLFGILDLRDDITMYYFVIAVVVLVWWGVYRIINSPYGEVLKAIKNNEQRVLSLGYNVNNCKLMAFVISGGVAGVAGSLKAMVFGMASLSDVHWHLSADGVIMMILGGFGSIISPVLGAFIMVSVLYFLSGHFDSLVSVIMGVIFVCCVMSFRGGIIEIIRKLFGRLAKAKA